MEATATPAWPWRMRARIGGGHGDPGMGTAADAGPRFLVSPQTSRFSDVGRVHARQDNEIRPRLPFGRTWQEADSGGGAFGPRLLRSRVAPKLWRS